MDAPLASSSTAIADAETTMTRGSKIQWPGGIKQNFSLPSSIMYYITMNPTNPKVYKKLIQTCKYFFERNPILVAATITEKAICSNVKCSGSGFGRCCVGIDVRKITSKIWVTRRLNLYQNTIPNFTTLLQPWIYRCEIVTFFIGKRIIDFEEFKFFGLSAKNIDLNQTQIVSNNGTLVMLENILEVLPNVQNFKYYFKNNASIVSASTVKNISKLKNLGNLKKLNLWKIPEDFKLDDLFTFIKDHNGIKFRFVFDFSISEHYKIQLDHLTDSLIESKLSNCCIFYRDQNEGKLEILCKR